MDLNKTIFRYSLFSLGVFLFGKIYTLFGHGVTSTSMSYAYLYLLGLGVLGFFLLKIIAPDIVNTDGYLLSYQTYNSGVAILINGMLLKGILEIAGGTSSYIPWFFVAGYLLIVIAFLMFVQNMVILFHRKKSAK
jgi:hypothetical protein